MVIQIVLILLQNKIQTISHLELLLTMNIRTYSANRLSDDNTDEISRNHSMVTGKCIVENSQSPTQTTSVFPVANMNNIETNKSKAHTEFPNFHLHLVLH